MHKTLYLLVLISFLQLSLQAQHDCGNGRYTDTAFFTAVDTFIGVQYGINTTAGGNSDTLLMDIYQPQGDTLSQRPLVIVAFGGSFVLGQREDLADLCQTYAQQGYVAATIDYRLYDGPLFPLPDSTIIADAVIRAVGDMKAAIRFFREDAATNNLYKIDPNLVFIGGGSAGAITACHAAYMDSTDSIPPFIQTAINNNGGFEGNTTNNTQYSSAVSGVLNFSGGLQRAGWINSGEAPLFSAHDDGDNIVPYEGGYGTIASFPLIYMEGSKLLHDTALAVGVPSQLITIPNSGGHVSYQSPTSPYRDSVFLGSSQFMEDIICGGLITHTTLATSQKTNYQLRAYPNPAYQDIQLALDKQPQGSYTLRVINSLGQVVYQQTSTQQFVQLARRNFAAGWYNVHIQFEDREVSPIYQRIIFR